jgi:hypothetical protein
MQASRVSLAAAAGGKPSASAWESLKNKFKSKFMIGQKTKQQQQQQREKHRETAAIPAPADCPVARHLPLLFCAV